MGTEDSAAETAGDSGAADDTSDPDTMPGETDSADTSPLDQDGDGFYAEGDCDDHNAAVNPSAPEECDGRDQDCDGVIDDACAGRMSGDLGSDVAQAALVGASESSLWDVGLVGDIDGDGLFDVLCYNTETPGEFGNLLAVRGPFSGERVVDPAADVLLDRHYESATVYLIHPRLPDVNEDGRAELFVPFAVNEGENWTAHVPSFDDPHLGMTIADASLDVGLYAYEYIIINVYGVVLPGDSGAIVATGVWTDGFESLDSETWIIPADASGTLDISDQPTLGPGGRLRVDSATSVPVDAGDMNGDGEHELLVYKTPTSDIYFGPLAPSLGERDPDAQLGAASPNDDWNDDYPSRGFPADLDGDGYDELLVQYGSGGTTKPDYGEALFVVRAAAGTARRDESPIVFHPDGGLGSVSLLDLNGDGAVDLATSDSGAEDGAGVVFVNYGPFGGSREIGVDDDARIHGDQPDEYLGESVSGGDVNGDGFDDLLVDAGLERHDGNNGTAWLFLGGP